MFGPAALLAVSLLLSCGAGATGGGGGGPAPELDFSLPSVDGPRLGPADYSGRTLLVEFWATWCTPCRAQAQILESLHEELGAEGEVGFLAVSLGEEEETVREFVRKSPFPYPVLMDTQDSLSPLLGIYALPTVMIVDRAGQIAYLRMGLSTAEDLREALASLSATPSLAGV